MGLYVKGLENLFKFYDPRNGLFKLRANLNDPSVAQLVPFFRLLLAEHDFGQVLLVRDEVVGDRESVIPYFSN